MKLFTAMILFGAPLVCFFGLFLLIGGMLNLTVGLIIIIPTGILSIVLLFVCIFTKNIPYMERPPSERY